MNAIEIKHREMEEAITFSTQTIDEIQEKNKTLEGGISKMVSQLSSALKKIETLEEASLQLERHSRGFNLRFGGIQERPSEAPSFAFETVKQILADKFNMPDAEIEIAHRSGRTPRTASDKPRHILARFIYRPERQTVLMRAKAALANSGLFVLQDLPAADVAKKRSLRDIMKSAYDRGQHPVFRGGHLYIHGMKYEPPQA